MDILIKDAILKELDDLHLDEYVQSEAERILAHFVDNKWYISDKDKMWLEQNQLLDVFKNGYLQYCRPIRSTNLF